VIRCPVLPSRRDPPRSPTFAATARAPGWSLRALRLLLGHALVVAPDAVAAFAGRSPDPCRTSRCRLLFDAIGLALASESARHALDGLLGPLLAREAARFAERPLADLALLGREPLPPEQALALLWLLGRHPCWAARRLEERIALRLELRLATSDAAPIGAG
jgi:hypothetical protein